MKNLALPTLLAVTLLLTACGSKITSDNFQQIHDGMTTDQVKAILGNPTEVQTQSMMGIGGTTYIYHTGSADVKIVFVNDKELTKEGTFK